MARRTKEEAMQTRERLLDMAEREFLRRGVSQTSLEQVARAAGVTRGAVYWHFKGKTDLFNAMINRVSLPLNDAILRSGARALDDPLQQIRGSYLAALRATVDDAQTRRVFEIALFKVEHGQAMRGVRARRVRVLHERVQQVERGLRRAARLGLCRAAVPAHSAALGIDALVLGLLQSWLLAPESFDLVAVGERTIDAFLAGLRAQ